jgi:hypothetical protein
VAPSALLLTPSLAAPDPAHTIRVTGYEPQCSGVLGDEPPAHFTIEAIHRIPSRSYRSLEPHKLAKRLACYHPRSPRAHLPRRTPQSLRACSDAVRPSYVLWTLVQVVSWPTLDVRYLPPICLRPSPPPSAFSLSHCALRIPPAGPSGISGRPAATTLPRSSATHRHRCRINRNSASSPPQPGVIRQQPDRPHSLPFSSARPPPHLRHVGQPLEAHGPSP